MLFQIKTRLKHLIELMIILLISLIMNLRVGYNGIKYSFFNNIKINHGW